MIKITNNLDEAFKDGMPHISIQERDSLIKEATDDIVDTVNLCMSAGVPGSMIEVVSVPKHNAMPDYFIKFKEL